MVRTIGTWMVILAGVTPAVTEAQTAAPRADTIAIGGDVGFLASDSVTSEDGSSTLDAATGSADAFVEYYYTERVSFRAMYGWAAPRFRSVPELSLRRQHLNVNVLYNWDIGRLRPFAAIGGGTYFVSRRREGNTVGRTLAKPGGALGAGAEYYFRTFAVRSEMSVHVLNDEKEIPELDGATLTGFTWTFGVKVPF
jgi:hypothetical protein